MWNLGVLSTENIKYDILHLKYQNPLVRQASPCKSVNIKKGCKVAEIIVAKRRTRVKLQMHILASGCIEFQTINATAYNVLRDVMYSL